MTGTVVSVCKEWKEAHRGGKPLLNPIRHYATAFND